MKKIIAALFAGTTLFTSMTFANAQALPRTPLLEHGPAAAPYNPPTLDNPSERVMQSDESFPLNRGLSNNPTSRDEYMREQLNK